MSSIAENPAEKSTLKGKDAFGKSPLNDDLTSEIPEPVAIPLFIKFEDLQRLLSPQQTQSNESEKSFGSAKRDLMVRLGLWATDICGRSETSLTTPSQVLQIIEDTYPNNVAVKTTHRCFDQLRKSALGNPSDSQHALEIFNKLSDNVKAIRQKYTEAMNIPHQSVILSFDGGGIRSYSSLLILQAIMDEVHTLVRGQLQETKSIAQETKFPLEQESLPRDYFDYFFGTSSGGLLAIMLGRLRMKISNSISAFVQCSCHVFDHPRKIPLLFGIGAAYSSKTVESVIQELLAQKELDKSQPWKRNKFVVEGDPCRTAVYAMRKNLKSNTEELHTFRTYDGIEDPSRKTKSSEKASEEPIWLIARATSAAPRYFEPVTLDGFIYQDAGIGYNNPVLQGLLEVKQLAGQISGKNPSQHLQNKSLKESVGLVISIGTGKRKLRSIFPPSRWYPKIPLIHALHIVLSAVGLVTDTENLHTTTERLCEISGIEYYRFNVDSGLENMTLDGEAFDRNPFTRSTARTLKYVEFATKNYLAKSEVKENIKAAARALVVYRRPRVPPLIE